MVLSQKVWVKDEGLSFPPPQGFSSAGVHWEAPRGLCNNQCFPNIFDLEDGVGVGELQAKTFLRGAREVTA